MNNKLVDYYFVKNKITNLSSYILNDFNKNVNEIIIIKNFYEFSFYTDHEKEEDESIISLNYLVHNEDKFKVIFNKNKRNIKEIIIDIYVSYIRNEKFNITKEDILDEKDIYDFFENLKENTEIKRLIDKMITNQNFLLNNAGSIGIQVRFDFKKPYTYTNPNLTSYIYKLINMELHHRNIFNTSYIFWPSYIFQIYIVYQHSYPQK